MAGTLGSFVSKLENAGKNIEKAQTKGVQASLALAKDLMIASADAVNTPHQLAGRSKGNAWGVRYRWFKRATEAEAVIFYWGAPPYWRQRGINPHEIAPKKGHEAMLANGLYFVSASSPGVGARPFWEPTQLEIQRLTAAAYQLAVLDALIKANLGHD